MYTHSSDRRVRSYQGGELPLARIQIAPRALEAARDAVDLSQEEVAARLKLSIQQLAELEAGEPPTATTLQKLARLYGRSIASLLVGEFPVEKAPPDYRTAAGLPLRENRDLIVALRRVRKWQQTVGQLWNHLSEEPRTRRVPRYSIDADPESLGRKLRDQLDVPLQDQLGWPDPNHALAVWRERVEALGALTFSVRLKRSVCRGFSIWSAKLPPAIALSTESPQAKIFTLLHEFGHLGLRQGGICLQQEDNTERGRTERFCNQLAAATLMPRDEFIAIVREMFDVTPARPKRDWHRNDVRHIADEFKVSVPACALRLEETRLAPRGLYDSVTDSGDSDDDRPRGGGGHWPGVKIAEMGGAYSETIYKSWQQGLVNAADAALAMNMPTKYVPLMGEALQRRHDRLG